MRAAGGTTLLFLLIACASAPRHQVTDFRDLPSHRLLIVGKIELHPPLQPGEQSIAPGRDAEIKDTFLLLAGDALKPAADEESSESMGLFEVKFDAEFTLAMEKERPVYIHGGIYYTAYDPPARVEAHTFDSPLKVDLRPDDQAVYVGTIQYHRDLDHNLKSVMVRDDYPWAEKQFKDRFGAGTPLRKALARPVPAVQQ